MILYKDQKPIYLTLMTDALYERYELQFGPATDWQIEACKEEFAAYLQNNPDSAVRIFLGWQSSLKSRALYHRFYHRWADPFSFGDEDCDRLAPFIKDATDVFGKLNADSLESVLRQYPTRLVSVPHPEEALS